MIFSWTDRYGGIWPDLAKACNGPCEGTGFYPLKHPAYNSGDLEPYDADLRGLTLVELEEWQRIHNGAHGLLMFLRNVWWTRGDLRFAWRELSCDGWHFVTCPTCSGTGKRR